MRIAMSTADQGQVWLVAPCSLVDLLSGAGVTLLVCAGWMLRLRWSLAWSLLSAMG